MTPRLLAIFPDAVWPPTAGNRVRNHAVLRALAGAFDLTILFLAHDRDETRLPAPLTDLGRVIPLLAPHRTSAPSWFLRHLRARWSRFDGLSPTAYFQSPPVLGRKVASLLRDETFDIVHAAYWYTLRGFRTFPRPPLWCLDTHDVFFERESLLYGALPPRARAEEERMIRNYDLVVGITPKDVVSLRPLMAPGSLLIEAGMGVEVSRWSDVPPDPVLASAGRDWVAFFGALSNEPNRRAVGELVRDVFPRVLAAHPKAGLLILGSSPGREIRAFGSDAVRVSGTVEDPASHLAACKVMALPLRVSSGFRTRAVEAMAAGLPIVAYAAAMDGLVARTGVDWLPAGSPGEMAERILELLRDEVRARKMGLCARETVAGSYTVERTYGKIPAAYAAMLEGKKSHPGR